MYLHQIGTSRDLASDIMTFESLLTLRRFERRLRLSLVTDMVVRLIISLFHFFIMFLDIGWQIVSEIPFLVGKRRLVPVAESGLSFVGGDRMIGRVLLMGCLGIIAVVFGAVGS